MLVLFVSSFYYHLPLKAHLLQPRNLRLAHSEPRAPSENMNCSNVTLICDNGSNYTEFSIDYVRANCASCYFTPCLRWFSSSIILSFEFKVSLEFSNQIPYEICGQPIVIEAYFSSSWSIHHDYFLNLDAQTCFKLAKIKYFWVLKPYDSVSFVLLDISPPLDSLFWKWVQPYPQNQ